MKKINPEQAAIAELIKSGFRGTHEAIGEQTGLARKQVSNVITIMLRDKMLRKLDQGVYEVLIGEYEIRPKQQRTSNPRKPKGMMGIDTSHIDQATRDMIKKAMQQIPRPSRSQAARQFNISKLIFNQVVIEIGEGTRE